MKIGQTKAIKCEDDEDQFLKNSLKPNKINT